MKPQTFEEYLQDKHAEQYYGTDDCMPDDMNDWITNLDVQEVIDFAERWGKQEVLKEQDRHLKIINA